MQQLFPIFYRQYGLRRVQTLMNPVPMTVSSLPRNSMIHYYSGDSENLDIDTSKLFYGVNARKIIIDFPERLTSELGPPRLHPVILRERFKPFLIQNKKFRYLRDGYQKVDDALTLFVNNYSYLDKVYTYPLVPMVRYYKWFNAYKTIFDTIGKVTEASSKNHFVFVDVPDEIPSLNLLNIYKDKSNASMLKIFDTSEKLFVLSLYRWIANSNDSENIFKDLQASEYPRINIVFNTKDGRSNILNLGYLSSWIKGRSNTTEFTTVTQVDPLQLQKLLLKFLMTLQSFKQVEETLDTTTATGETPVDSDEKELIEAQAEYDREHGTEEDELDPHEYDDALSFGNREVTNTKTQNAMVFAQASDKALSEAINSEETLDDQLKVLDEELQTFEDLTVRKLKDKGLQLSKTGDIQEEVIAPVEASLPELQQKVYQFESSESALKRQVEAQADYGLISASDYRKFMQDIEKYKVAPEPYGSKVPTHKAMVISTDDVQLSAEKAEIVASEMVQDKSMLQSSLQSFDQDYISKVMRKDTLSMVDGLQKAGVLIRKHEIEIDHSALGSYESHTLELKPVDGQVSTLRFKIPVVSEDGTYSISSVKQVLRKQRCDVPIRKIRPTEVALTSYYGKTFVRLNAKKANSSLEWIIKELNIASMTTGGYIQRVNPAKVFDNNFEAPYIYNALADNFKSIITSKYTLNFDHSDRKTMANEIQLENLEANGSRVVGTTSRKELIVVDKNDIFQVVSQDGNLTPIGDIYTVLELDTAKMPIDFSEVNIFSKSVPVAFILGYTLGFKNLIKLLQVKYRTTEGRAQKNLLPHEYSISFKDYSYIFSRKDRVATMILAGYNEFEKQLKQYEVDEFNHKDVYLNLLETKGLSSIYIREIELTQQLFVDPITKEILTQMKEPVTFNGLLIRATELMQTYHHPDSQDMKVMRIRGYERIPGAIYKEMVTAIRQYRNKNIAGKSKIDMSPYQIWSNICKDPASKIVEDINPIQNLKESEIVTYAGEGGRGKDSMNKASRAYHQNDMGIVSEATVDSSDVGVNAYLSANPKFKDLRGLPLLDGKVPSPSSLISTSALLTNSSDKDDPKRVYICSKSQ